MGWNIHHLKWHCIKKFRNSLTNGVSDPSIALRPNSFASILISIFFGFSVGGYDNFPMVGGAADMELGFLDVLSLSASFSGVVAMGEAADSYIIAILVHHNGVKEHYYYTIMNTIIHSNKTFVISHVFSI